MSSLKKMGLLFSSAIYIAATLLLFVQTHYTIPYFANITGEEPILFWFVVGGLGVFLPLLLTALFILKKENYKLNLTTWRERLRFRKMTQHDWYWSIIGVVFTMLISGGLLFGLTAVFGEFETSPPFMHFTPFNITGKYWLFLLWVPYWVLNILGEEILWRGVMMPRQELVFGKLTWLVAGLGWTLFHLAFGWKLLITIIPLIFIETYVVQKTKNSWNGVVMHAFVNGPSFIAIALGII